MKHEKGAPRIKGTLHDKSALVFDPAYKLQEVSRAADGQQRVFCWVADERVMIIETTALPECLQEKMK